MSGSTSYEPTPDQWTIIWVLNGVLVLTVIALVVTEAVMLVQARWTRQAGSGLQLRMVAMFAFAAAVPAAIVAVVATVALNQGLDQWFSERNRVMVESSRQVARSYMAEHAEVLRDDVIWVANELEQAQGDLRQRYADLPAHPDRARGDAVAALHLAGRRRRRHA